MKEQIRAGILGLAAAATLVACASKAPASSTASSGAVTQDKIASEYQSVIANASKPAVCQTLAVTGSRLQTREICRTPADLDDEHQSALGALQYSRQTEAMPRETPASSPNGRP